MNNVYNAAREIYTIRGDMCYENKVMMPTVPSDRQLEEGVMTPADFASKQKKTTLSRLRARLRTTLLVDILIIVIVGLLVCLLEFGVVPSARLGFWCRDPAISHPFRGDTVSVANLLLSGYFGPLLVIYAAEALRGGSGRACLGTVWGYYRECLVGATLVLLVTEVVKVLVGEPRPHFLDSCEPDVNKVCKEGTFVLEYNCTNDRMSAFFRTDITRSFPSGHTSVSLFVAIYCSYLIQIRIPSGSVSMLTKPLLISVCLTWSLLCSLSRITDRRHHWWDVLGGAFLGMCGALYTLTLLHQKEKKERVKNRLSRTSTTMTTLSEVKHKDSTGDVI